MANPPAISALQLRANLLHRIRAFFEQHQFLEVETPLLSRDSVVDRHIDPIEVTLFADATSPEIGSKMWLQTSPEFAMKRLLAAGAPSLYQICKAFRGGAERGPLHNPEFTMVEWYGLDHDYATGMRLLSELADCIFERGPAKCITYQAAFEQHAGVDPFDNAVVAKRFAELFPDEAMSNVDYALDRLLTSVVEPHLGQGAPTILCDYPPSQAALAQVRSGPPAVAERFELYVDGIELANGYHELLDANILRRRNAEANELRKADGKYTLPEESELLAAMEHGLPHCTGCALGFDRAVMIVAWAKSIDEVLPFPIERA